MESHAKVDYSSLTVKALIQELKKRDIHGYGGKVKAQLVKMLEANDASINETVSLSMQKPVKEKKVVSPEPSLRSKGTVEGKDDANLNK